MRRRPIYVVSADTGPAARTDWPPQRRWLGSSLRWSNEMRKVIVGYDSREEARGAGSADGSSAVPRAASASG